MQTPMEDAGLGWTNVWAILAALWDILKLSSRPVKACSIASASRWVLSRSGSVPWMVVGLNG